LIFVNLIQKANKICVGIWLDLPERVESGVDGVLPLELSSWGKWALGTRLDEGARKSNIR